jgi:hypothetical protein
MFENCGILRRILVLLVLLVALTVSSGASAQSVVAQQALPESSATVIEIPIRLSLERLFEVAEQEMPLQAGNWRDWRKTRGIKTKYRAWRGPLYLTAQGNVLLVQAHVRYWIKAQKKMLGAVTLRSSCGVNEPPRQAVIGVQIRLDWGPDWMLRPLFRVMPTRFLDRCEMTMANIDVTPFVEKEFQKQLKNKMRDALVTLAPRLQTIRQQAERSWLQLQEPVPLWAQHWLLLNPRGVALSPLAGHGEQLDTRLAIMMVPSVVSGSQPSVGYQPLPPLARFYPHRSGLELQLVIDLSYEDLSYAVNRQLSGKLMKVGGYQAGVDAIELGGEGREVSVKARLTGDAAGNLSVKADMLFIPETQQLALRDLEYSYVPESSLLKSQANLFYGYIREALETAANRQLQEYLKLWKQQLMAVFERITPDEIELDPSSFQLRHLQVSMREDAISLNGLASGHMRLGFR